MAGKAQKRKAADLGEESESCSGSNAEKKLPLCKYGSSCYRKNEEHRRKYSHCEKDPRDSQTQTASDTAEELQSVETSGDTCTDVGKVTSGEEAKNIEECPSSPENVKENIKQKFLFEMPDDFYKFWEFCQSCNPSAPAEALHSVLGLTLVGPFDVLAQKLKNKNVERMEEFLCHWRYYYDPPEFQTIIKGDDSSLYHIGYYRDLPNEPPVFVASNEAAKGCEIKELGGNLFAAINSELNEKLKKHKGDQNKKLLVIQKKLQDFSKSNEFKLQCKSNRVCRKGRKYVSKTFHRAGIVVPVHGDVGYRPLGMSEAHLKSILKKISESKTEAERNKNFDELQELINRIQFANDECDFSMGYELGINIFCLGDESFHPTILFLLSVAYELLDWQEYAQIIKAHLANRKKGANLSVLSA